MNHTLLTALICAAGLACTATAQLPSSAARIGQPTSTPTPNSERLGQPVDMIVARGSGIASGGGGLHFQPALIALDVPAHAQVRQVIAYWHGLAETANGGDDTIRLNGTEVQGRLIGEPTLFFKMRGIFPRYSIAYRADVTSLGLVQDGTNYIAVDGADFLVANGVGFVVIYADGSSATIELRDGTDNAFVNFDAPLDTTAAQTYSFAPSQLDRQGEFLFMVAGVEYLERPAAISVSIDNGPETLLFGKIRSRDYLEWDTYVLPLTIPAGASSVTLQVLSMTDESEALPASLTWITSSMVLPEPPLYCDGTPLFWSQNLSLWPQTGFDPQATIDNTFTTQFTALVPIFSGVLGDLSLNEALVAPSGIAPLGPVRELMREGTAALLNASSPLHTYPYPAPLLKDALNIILATYDLSVYQLATEILRTWNEQACVPPEVR